MVDTFDIYPLFVERPGVATLAHKRHPAEEKRIDVIVSLAKKHDELLAAGDYWGLVELSYEYDLLKYMHNTAAQIRAEAAEMEKEKA